jgi:NADP-dependent 3-hydroxy acid dehydrogenase YdfG
MDIDLKPLITGASSGIGVATAEAAAEPGAKLVLAARSGETLAEVA